MVPRGGYGPQHDDAARTALSHAQGRADGLPRAFLTARGAAAGLASAFRQVSGHPRALLTARGSAAGLASAFRRASDLPSALLTATGVRRLRTVNLPAGIRLPARIADGNRHAVKTEWDPTPSRRQPRGSNAAIPAHSRREGKPAAGLASDPRRQHGCPRALLTRSDANRGKVTVKTAEQQRWRDICAASRARRQRSGAGALSRANS